MTKDKITLDATAREVVGKKVKQLRREGITPVVVYGPGFEPLHLQVDARTLRSTLATAGGTKIIELTVGKEQIPTLARRVQRNPIYGDILHVDFYRIQLDRVIRAEVPVILVGEPNVVASGQAIVVHLMNSIEVEALPAELPPHIEVDVTPFNEIGMAMAAGEITSPKNVSLIVDPEEIVFKIEYATAIVEEEEEEEGSFLQESAEVEVIRERKHEEEAEEE